MPSVLIVDDDPRVADVLLSLLRDEGYHVSCESDGLQALNHIELDRPDVVLADIKMPNLDGISLARMISSRWGQICVILMSAAEKPLGVKLPYLQKPFDLDEVVTTIVDACSGFTR